MTTPITRPELFKKELNSSLQSLRKGAEKLRLMVAGFNRGSDLLVEELAEESNDFSFYRLPVPSGPDESKFLLHELSLLSLSDLTLSLFPARLDCSRFDIERKERLHHLTTHTFQGLEVIANSKTSLA